MRTLMLTTIAASALAATTLSAGFLGLTAEPFVGDGWACNGFFSQGVTAWRIYANFDGKGDDGVIAVFTQPGSPWSMSSSNGVFENTDPPFNSHCEPEDLTDIGIWQNQWDTYVTIGRTDAEGFPCSVDSFAKCVNNLEGDFTCENGGIFATPVDEFSIAVDRRVLLGQFTVNDGEVVTGRLNLLTRENQTFKDEEIVPIDCRIDFDRSRDVGFGDLLIMLQDWGPCVPHCTVCRADLDNDRTVTFQDLLILLQAWGDC